jgi:hypothetical protein
MIGKGPLPGVRMPGATVRGERTIRVTPEGKVEGELRLGPVAPVPPAPPVPPAKPRAPAAAAQAAEKAARALADRMAAPQNDNAKLDAILKKLDKLDAVDRLEKEFNDLRREVDALRKSDKK